MKHAVYTVIDKKLETFNPPFVARTNAGAMRQFSDLANDPQTTISRHPEDYALLRVGKWDDDTGEITPEEHTKLAEAKDYTNGNITETTSD